MDNYLYIIFYVYTTLLLTEEIEMSELLQKMSELLAQNVYLAILIAFAAGVLTVFTPCSLTSVPLIVTCINSTEQNKKKKAFVYSILICLGQAIVFVVMGLIAASIGFLMNWVGFEKVWHLLLALLMLWMALEMFGVTNILHKKHKSVNKKPHGGMFGALGVGMLTALFATPCSTPVFTAMLAFVSAANLSVLYGGLLLLGYALGHSIPLVITGSTLSFVQSVNFSKKFNKTSKIIKIVFGILLLALTAYLIISAFL